LNPVTRRALRIHYVSPSSCPLPQDISSAASGSSDSDALSSIDFVETSQVSGPTLTVSQYTTLSLRLQWTEVVDAGFYQIYRATSALGPFVLLQTPVGGTEYIDIPPADGEYFYQVTAVEPNAGETAPSNVASGELGVAAPLPPIPGYVLLLTPDSDRYRNADGTQPALPGHEVRFCQDLSGNNNHLVFDGSVQADSGPVYSATQLNGHPTLDFGARTGLLSLNNQALTSGLLVFVVVAPEASENNATVFGFNSDRALLRRDGTTDVWETFKGISGNQLQALSSSPNGQFEIIALRMTAAQTRIYVAGALSNSASDLSAIVSSGKFAIGYREDDAVESHLTGKVVEVIVYPFVLSGGDQDSVTAYLQAKYNL
jgi:hypothetical protein